MAVPYSCPMLEKSERLVQVAGLWMSKMADYNVTPCWPKWLPEMYNYTVEDNVTVVELAEMIVQTLLKISSLENSKVALDVLRLWP
jgi:hypothetical protein